MWRRRVPGSEKRRRAPIRRRVRLRSVLLGAFVAVVMYYLVSLYQVVHTGNSDNMRRSDAIVVLGAAQYDGRPSPQLAARLDHAADLFAMEVAPIVYVTGGKQPGDRFTEAEASKAYLVDKGVPETAIVEENYGHATFESLRNIATLMPDGSSVVIVTDPYHALRSKLTADEVGLDAVASPTPTSVVTGGHEFRRDLAEAGGVAVGRIVGFGRLSGWVG